MWEQDYKKKLKDLASLLYPFILDMINTAAKAIGIVWSLLEIGSGTLKSMEKFELKVIYIVAPAVLAACWSLYRSIRQYFCHEVKIPHSEQRQGGVIAVSRGDLLKKTDGSMLIGINDELKTRPDEIGEGSIHQHLALKYKDVIEERFNVVKETFNEKGIGPCYDMGTAFDWTRGDSSYIFLVMSSMHDASHAIASTKNLKKAIYAFFHNQTNINIKNKTLYCPVLGTGPGGIPLPPERVIIELCRQFVLYKTSSAETGSDRIRRLEIVVWPPDARNMDWNDMLRHLDSIVYTCRGCIDSI